METYPTESISVLSHSFSRLSTSLRGGLRNTSSPMNTSVSSPALSVRKKPAYRLLIPFSSLINVKWDVLYCEGNLALPRLSAVSWEICLNSDLFQLSTKKILKRLPGRESSVDAAIADGRLLE